MLNTVWLGQRGEDQSTQTGSSPSVNYMSYLGFVRGESAGGLNHVHPPPTPTHTQSPVIRGLCAPVHMKGVF